jgi:hypothetical protein
MPGFDKPSAAHVTPTDRRLAGIFSRAESSTEYAHPSEETIMARHQNAAKPAEIDDIEDRMGSMEQLDFPDDELRGRIGDERPVEEVNDEYPAERRREMGMTGASVDDHQPTADDLAPETLIDEEGSRSRHERGHGLPVDKDLSVVPEDAIGGGSGLDEAELASQEPLESGRDRKPGPVEKKTGA